MSAEHAHSAEHHEAHGHGHHGPNAMHFNNGGVLGIAEAIGRLAKGVTYDAAVDTFGGAHGGHAEHGAHAEHGGHADHAHPAPAAHADAAHGDAHGAGHEHGGHGALATAAAVGHAVISAHDEHKDPFDVAIDKLAHLNHVHPMFGGTLGKLFPLIASGAKWAKEKLYPTIHEIPVDDQHIGDQILHKLKKNKKPDKDGHITLDHHALEGFCMGIDIANLERTFYMFTDPVRFEKALKRDAGKEELKKQIANMLDWSGEVDQSILEKQVEKLFELLGIGVQTDEHGHEHPHAHKLDSRVAKKHEALMHIIWNMRQWLTQGKLDKIYGTEEKNDYEMDYKHIGDRVLKLKDDTLVKFLKRVKQDGIDDIENEVGDLLRPDSVAAELKHNPDDLREQISNLFNVKGGVTVAKLKERKEQIENRLKYKEVTIVVEEEDPSSTTTPKATIKVPKKVMKVNSGDPLLDEIGTKFVNEILEPAFANLTEDVLKKLYPLAEDSEASFKWTEDKYRNFGATIFNELNGKNRKAVLESLDTEKLTRTLKLLFPVRTAMLENSEGKKQVKNQLKLLLNIEEPFDASDLKREAESIKKALRTPTGVTPSTKESENLIKLTELLDSLTRPASRKVAAGPFSDDKKVEKLFEGSSPVGPENFVSNFRDLEESREIAAFIRGYKSPIFRAHFDSLFSGDLVNLAENGTAEEKNQARREIRKFVGLTGDAKVRYPLLVSVLTDFEETIKKAKLPDTDAGVVALRADLTEIGANVTTDALDKLFGPEKPKVIPINYDNFGAQFATLPREDIPGYLRSFNEITFMSKFPTIHNADILDKQLSFNKRAAQDEIKNFFNVTGPVSDEYVDQFISTLKQRFSASISREDAAYFRIFSESLDNVKKALMGRTRRIFEP